MTDQRPSRFNALCKRAYRTTLAHAHWLALGLLLAVGLFSLWNSSRLIAANRAQTQLRDFLNSLKGGIFTVDDAETGSRGYLLVGDESYLEPYERAVLNVENQFDHVAALLVAVPGQEAHFETLRGLVTQKFAILKQMIQVRKTEGFDAALLLVRSGRGKQTMDHIRGLVNQINDASQERLAAYDRQIVALSYRATAGGVLGNALAAILFVTVLRRDCLRHEKVVSRARDMVRSSESSRQETIKQADQDIEALGQQARELAVVVETSRKETLMQTEEKIEAIGQQAVELARSVESLRIQSAAQAEETIESVYQQPRDMAVEIEALGQQARELARSVESSRIQTLHQSDEKIEALGQQARDLARAVEMSRLQTLKQSDKEIEALGQQARDLATFVESSRMQTLMQSDDKIEALGQQARDLATSVETSRMQTLMQSDGKIEALGQRARDLATSVESARLQTLTKSDKEIEALGQRARDLAKTVETSRLLTLKQSDKEIEALGQQARDLAMSVESSRIKTLKQSDKEIEALAQQARDLAAFVESSRMQTLMQSDGKIEALGQQARELARCVETLRVQTLKQSDGKIDALGQQARELAAFVETARIETLNQSNQEIRKLNEELEQRVLERTAQLQAANKELDAFSYSVSHDLRAPLRAIDGFSRIVLEDYGGPLAEEGKAYLQMVRDNTRQMGLLVDDLLAFARLGRQALTKHAVDPGKIVRRCLEEMSKEQEGRQVEVTIGEMPPCEADAPLLKQVWTNLISNALKYTRKQEKARIEIGCRTEPRPALEGQPASTNGKPEVVYYVKDNGAGFDMKYVRKLFGVFQRLHRAADYEGTGVGLAIVQRIVQRHGGRIWGDAKLNEGATFSFTLA